MTTMQGIMPMFIVADLAVSIAFYRDVLGFEIRMMYPDTDPFFGIVGREGVGIMLKHVSKDVPPLPNSKQHEWAKWDAFISTPDPEALATECNMRCREIDLEVRDTDDGLRGIEVADADGYVLFFGHPLGT